MVEKSYRFPELIWSKKDNALKRPIEYAAGNITHKSNIPKSENMRPLSLRGERAEIYKKITLTKDSSERKTLIEKAHDFDDVFSEFLNNRKQVEVDLGELGVQSAEYTEIRYKKTDLEKEPILIIPGISNDLDGIGEFPIRLAMESKRRVIVITHPESWHGKVTKKFAEEIGKSNNFKPHVDFFRSAIKQIAGDQELDLIGVSAGSIITAELMQDEEFKKRINKTSLIVPPGLVNMDFKNMIKGIRREIKSKLFYNENEVKISVLHPEIIKKSSDDRENQLLAFKNIYKKLSQEYGWWKYNLTSKNGEKTKVIIGDTDGITNGIDGIDKIKQNPSLELRMIRQISHGTLASNPERVLPELNF